MSRRHSYTSVVQASEKRKIAERERLRHKILYQWGILVFIGAFSFLYWFVVIPLVAPKLPASWSLIGPIAFLIWLIIIAPFIWLWHSKLKVQPLLPSPYNETAECQTFPTTVSTVQPFSEAKLMSSAVTQESYTCVPVQPGNVTPSMFNSETGRDSFQSGYQMDEMPEKSSVQGEKTISRNNSAVQLTKKFDAEAKLMNSHRLISVSSSSSTELGGLDFKKIQRDPGDGLDAGEGNGEECGEEGLQRNEEDSDEDTQKEEKQASYSTSTNTSSNTSKNTFDAVDSVLPSQAKAVASADTTVVARSNAKTETEPAPLSREESFKGLPEMQNFGEYLHLVAVDTPMSPRDAFFSDLGQTEPQKDIIEIRKQHRKSYHPGGDLSDVQRRIAEARKSLPPLFHYPDLEIGETRVLKTTTLPQPAVLRLEDEHPVRKSYVRSASEGRKSSWEASCRQARLSGEFFVADATRLDSVTSEVQMTVDPLHGTTQLSRWEAVVSGNGVNPSMSSSSTKTDVEEPPQGRWVILSRDYASNNLEAFIRIEQEMMSKERSRALLPSEDTDDCVFMEVDHGHPVANVLN